MGLRLQVNEWWTASYDSAATLQVRSSTWNPMFYSYYSVSDWYKLIIGIGQPIVRMLAVMSGWYNNKVLMFMGYLLLPPCNHSPSMPQWIQRLRLTRCPQFLCIDLPVWVLAEAGKVPDTGHHRACVPTTWSYCKSFTSLSVSMAIGKLLSSV